MSKKITLLGSTGSIGTQSLDVIRAQGYEVFGLSAHSHVEKILEQIEEFHPRYVCMTDPDAAARLDGVITKIKNAMQHALEKIQRTLMQPEVKQAGKEQIKKKAKESIMDKLAKAKQSADRDNRERWEREGRIAPKKKHDMEL